MSERANEVLADVFELDKEVESTLPVGLNIVDEQEVEANKSLWAIGILLEITAAFSGTMGKQLMRKAAVMKESGKSEKAAKYMLTFALVLEMSVGPLLDMAAYAFAPQMLVAPFQATQLVFNTLLAPCNLGEKLGVRHLIACVTIACAMALVAGFGRHDEPEYSRDILQDIIIRPAVLMYMAVFALWIAAAAKLQRSRPKGDTIRGLAMSLIAGSIAGNMWCVKACAEFLANSFRGDWSDWAHWFPWLVLLGAAGFALTQVFLLTRTMKEFEALFVISCYQSGLISSACLSGAIVLNEFQGIAFWRGIIYFFAVCLIVGGIMVLVKGEQKSVSDKNRADIVEVDAEDEIAEQGEQVVCDDGLGGQPDGPDGLEVVTVLSPPPHLSNSRRPQAKQSPVKAMSLSSSQPAQWQDIDMVDVATSPVRFDGDVQLGSQAHTELPGSQYDNWNSPISDDPADEPAQHEDKEYLHDDIHESGRVRASASVSPKALGAIAGPHRATHDIDTPARAVHTTAQQEGLTAPDDELQPPGWQANRHPARAVGQRLPALTTGRCQTSQLGGVEAEEDGTTPEHDADAVVRMPAQADDDHDAAQKSGAEQDPKTELELQAIDEVRTPASTSAVTLQERGTQSSPNLKDQNLN